MPDRQPHLLLPVWLRLNSPILFLYHPIYVSILLHPCYHTDGHASCRVLESPHPVPVRYTPYVPCILCLPNALKYHHMRILYVAVASHVECACQNTDRSRLSTLPPSTVPTSESMALILPSPVLKFLCFHRPCYLSWLCLESRIVAQRWHHRQN